MISPASNFTVFFSVSLGGEPSVEMMTMMRVSCFPHSFDNEEHDASTRIFQGSSTLTFPFNPGDPYSHAKTVQKETVCTWRHLQVSHLCLQSVAPDARGGWECPGPAWSCRFWRIFSFSH